MIRLESISSLHSSTTRLSAVAEDVIPSPADGGKMFPPKIEKIVQDISQLTLLETSQLNELLKVINSYLYSLIWQCVV